MAGKDENLNATEEKSEKGTKQEEVTKTEESEGKESPKKLPAKSPKKAVKTKAKTPKKESSDEGDESDDEELVGSLDKPLVIEGKRDRKSTEFLVKSFKQPEKKKIDIPEGKGETLGSMPRVVFQLGRIVADELKPLHRLLFGRAGVNSEVKRNIRSFNGFDIEKDSKEYQKKLEMVDRFTMDSLRRLCEILDVEKKGKKEDILERIMDFLMKPKASGQAPPESKKKPSKKTSGTKRKRTKKEKKTGSKKAEDKESESEEEKDEDEDEDEEEKEKEPPRKKKKTSEEKKATKGKKEAKKSPKKDKKVVPIKISGGKKQKKEQEKPVSDSSDDEPLSKKTKKSPPTDDEIVALVKELLDGADLEKITMKSVCKQVYDHFPDFDLTDRKEFIKDTVKEIIT